MNRSDIEDFEKDVSESQRIVAKYPEYVPVIVKSKKIKLKKRKFLVPKDVNISYLLIAIRKHIENVKHDTGIFIFCNNNLLGSNSMMGEIYEKYVCGIQTKNLFLYIDINTENTFG